MNDFTDHVCCTREGNVVCFQRFLSVCLFVHSGGGGGLEGVHPHWVLSYQVLCRAVAHPDWALSNQILSGGGGGEKRGGTLTK